MTTSLFIRQAAGLSLAQALAACDTLLPAGDTAIALLSSPDRCKFARLVKGAAPAFSGAPDGAIMVEEVYEARVFCPSWEMRWLKDANGGSGHRCALLYTEERRTEPTSLWTEVKISISGEIPGQYLLWGEKPTDLGNGWKCLTTSRIGSLEIPYADDLPADARVILKTVEYLREYEHGNIAVAEERLVCLDILRENDHAR